MFTDKTLLITGGTGTFGNAVLRRFLGTGVREIRVFSRDEKKQDDMRKVYADPKLRFYIGDVREPSSLKDAMVGVDFVFHAAAIGGRADGREARRWTAWPGETVDPQTWRCSGSGSAP